MDQILSKCKVHTLLLTIKAGLAYFALSKISVGKEHIMKLCKENQKDSNHIVSGDHIDL
jgi:hypothetical protein